MRSWKIGTSRRWRQWTILESDWSRNASSCSTLMVTNFSLFLCFITVLFYLEIWECGSEICLGFWVVAGYARSQGSSQVTFGPTDLVCCRTLQGHTGKVHFFFKKKDLNCFRNCAFVFLPRLLDNSFLQIYLIHNLETNGFQVLSCFLLCSRNGVLGSEIL